MKGFTIVETLIAISIVTLSITGASSIVQSSLQNANLIKTRTIAVGIANEAIEYVRNLRDEDSLQNTPFLQGKLNDFVSTCENGCSLDVFNLDNAYDTCVKDCPYMKLSDEGYNMAVGEGTPITRRIKTAYVSVGGDPDEVRITSIVKYTVFGREETIILESHLMDIR